MQEKRGRNRYIVRCDLCHGFWWLDDMVKEGGKVICQTCSRSVLNGKNKEKGKDGVPLR